MWNKLKLYLRRFWYGTDPPIKNEYEDLTTPDYDFLKPNGEEYRLPTLLKPPKVKFKYKQPKK